MNWEFTGGRWQTVVTVRCSGINKYFYDKFPRPYNDEDALVVMLQCVGIADTKLTINPSLPAFHDDEIHKIPIEHPFRGTYFWDVQMGQPIIHVLHNLTVEGLPISEWLKMTFLTDNAAGQRFVDTLQDKYSRLHSDDPFEFKILITWTLSDAISDFCKRLTSTFMWDTTRKDTHSEFSKTHSAHPEYEAIKDRDIDSRPRSLA